MSRTQLRDAILNLMQSQQAPTKSDLARALKLPVEQRAGLREALEALLREGQIVMGKKGCYHLPDPATSLRGTLKFHPKGHAYFIPDAIALAERDDAALLSRVYIARRDTGGALDGDRVQVTLIAPPPRRIQRRPTELLPPESEAKAKVDRVLERRSGRVVGIFQRKGRFGWIESNDKAIDGSIDLVGETTAEPGQLVVVELENRDDSRASLRGRIIEVLGWPGDAGVDLRALIHRFGLRTSFPDQVLAQARAVGETPDQAEVARREDWRQPLVITIDPADAKDHDDAIWVKKSAQGWTLAVHIADVSHYVKPGSPIDQEAIERGNSTYLVDRVLPMLPTELSNGICSLVPNVDRLTKCALLEISPQGETIKATFLDAVIHSRAKLSYEDAQAILDGQAAPAGSDPELVPMVREAWKLASVLRRRRFDRGALDLEMPEIKIRLDHEGRAVAADPVIHTASHQLVEECMLAANEAVAKILRHRMKPGIFRIHEDPDPSRLMDYTETARLHGYRPGDLTNRAHIQKLLDDSKGTPEEHIIKLGLLKSLKRAAYSAEPIGHYGLAKGDYCHFTSPIRRYADLLVHRALQPLLANPPARPDPTLTHAQLVEISRHASDAERLSADAESESKMIKLFEYLQRVVEMHDPHVFDGLVTDVRMMGLMVEIPAMGIRGVVRREDLPPGRWRFESHRLAWIAADGSHIQLGMRVPLHVTGLDFEKRFVDFAMAGPPTSPGTRPMVPHPAPPGRKRIPPPKPGAHPGPTTRPPKQRKQRQSRRHR